MNIYNYISELLFDHECVVLPGFGGFIASDVSATVNRITHRFTPPSKRIVFNIHLSANDGLLINHIAGKEKLTYKEAREAVDEFTESCKRQLDEGLHLKFEKIGTLHQNKEGHLVFEQSEEVNYNTEAFGLSSFYSPAIDRGTDEERLNKIIEPILSGKRKHSDRKPVRQKMDTRVRNRTMTAMMLFVLLLVIGGGFTFTENARTYWNNYAMLVPLFETKAPPAEELHPVPVEKNSNLHPAETETINTSVEKPVAEDNVIKSAEKPTVKPAGKPENKDNKTVISDVKAVAGSYLIIAGSFSNKQNAQKLVRQLKEQGMRAMMAGTSKSGMFRVAMATFPTLPEAKKELYAIRNDQYPDAWILRKK